MSEHDQDEHSWQARRESDEALGSDGEMDEVANHAVVPASDYLPERIYLLPIHNRPFFPAQVQPLVINRERWEETMRRVGNTPHHTLGVAFVGDTSVDELGHDHFPEIGTAVKVHKMHGEEGQLQFIAQGLRRFRIQRWLSKKPPCSPPKRSLPPPKTSSRSCWVMRSGASCSPPSRVPVRE